METRRRHPAQAGKDDRHLDGAAGSSATSRPVAGFDLGTAAFQERGERSRLICSKPLELLDAAAQHRAVEGGSAADGRSSFSPRFTTLVCRRCRRRSGAVRRLDLALHLDAAVNLLDGLRRECSDGRFFYAASSHLFGASSSALQDEQTPMAARACCSSRITKAAGAQATRYYRQRHDLHASVGILFNQYSACGWACFARPSRHSRSARSQTRLAGTPAVHPRARLALERGRLGLGRPRPGRGDAGASSACLGRGDRGRRAGERPFPVDELCRLAFAGDRASNSQEWVRERPSRLRKRVREGPGRRQPGAREGRDGLADFPHVRAVGKAPCRGPP